MGWSPQSVAQEIDALSKLTGIECRQFRHFIVSANKTDPLDFDPAQVSEAHLFIDEGSQQHQAFDEAIAAHHAESIMRYTQCKAEPGLAPNLCYVSAVKAKPAFEELANTLGIAFAWGIVTDPKPVLRYKPDDHLTWIVTYIKARMFNPTAYLASGDAQPGNQIGDMRSDDTDWNGRMNGWISVAGTPIWAQGSVPTMAFLNVPVLFAFQGGRKVALVVQRTGTSRPTVDFQLQFAMHGYLCPQSAAQIITMNATQIEQHTVGT